MFLAKQVNSSFLFWGHLVGWRHLATVFNMLEDIPHHYDIVKNWHGCISGQGAQGPDISVFNHLATLRCVLWRQGFSFLVCKTVARGDFSICNEGLQQC